MKIEKVIVSSDNSHYKDFYVPVKTVWQHFGIDVLHVEIANNVETELIEDNSYIIPEIKDIKTSLMAQLSRIYAVKKYPNCNMLISDIDMLPININYFNSNADKILDNQILFYSGQPYADGNKLFPMCYILGNSNILKEYFRLELFETFEDFINYCIEKYDGGWHSDEQYVYDCYVNYENKNNCIINEPRTFNDRIDRLHTSFNLKKLCSGYYKDAHLLRPYKNYKIKIDGLVKMIINMPSLWANCGVL